MNPYDVLRTPHITEKTETARAESATLCFKVHPEATKTDVKLAVQTVFGVDVAEVRTASFKGKPKSRGRYAGRRSSWKKAYVKLKDGQKMVEYAQV